MEKSGETAIIFAHIPPGSPDCMGSFSRRFYALIERYQHVARVSLYGHDHNEWFNVVNSVSTGKPINTDVISGSATTFTNLNPSYRVITLDKQHMIPVKIETYYINITEANETP